MSTCANNNTSLCLETYIHHSRQSTLDNEDPPAYSVAQVEETSTENLVYRFGPLCLFIIGLDTYFSSILFIFSFMSSFSTGDIQTTCVPLFYLLCTLLGKSGFKNVINTIFITRINYHS